MCWVYGSLSAGWSLGGKKPVRAGQFFLHFPTVLSMGLGLFPCVCEVGNVCLGIYCHPTSYIPIVIKVLIFHSCLYLSIHRPLSIMGKRRSPHLAAKGKQQAQD